MRGRSNAEGLVEKLWRVNALRAKLASTRHPIESQEVPADQSAFQGEKCLANVRPLFVAHAQSPELIQPSEGPLDYPAPSPSPLPSSVLRFARKGTMCRTRRPWD
jgi:hypothetical protein